MNENIFTDLDFDDPKVKKQLSDVVINFIEDKLGRSIPVAPATPVMLLIPEMDVPAEQWRERPMTEHEMRDALTNGFGAVPVIYSASLIVGGSTCPSLP